MRDIKFKVGGREARGYVVSFIYIFRLPCFCIILTKIRKKCIWIERKDVSMYDRTNALGSVV